MTRAGGLLGTVLVLLLTASCSVPSVPVRVSPRPRGPGGDAADAARAKAWKHAENAAMFRKQRQVLDRRRLELLAEARQFRRKALEAARNPALSKADRISESRHYRHLAKDREAQAGRYARLISTCSADAAVLENRRQRALRQARQFEQMKAPACP